MDSNELERERGITILAKNTAVHYHGHLINIVDTPGHADFGGEVERTLSMVDGVMLLVDASEGPLPQTRFVLRKALERRLPPIVVINKIDRSDARTPAVLNEVYDLFIDLDATEDQLDFPVLYTNARHGTATTDLEPPGHGPAPALRRRGRAHPGTARVGDGAAPGARRQSRLERLPRPAGHRPHLQRPRQGRRSDRGLQARRLDPADRRSPSSTCSRDSKRVDVTEAAAGDIICLAGIENIMIGETIADAEKPVADCRRSRSTSRRCR